MVDIFHSLFKVVSSPFLQVKEAAVMIAVQSPKHSDVVATLINEEIKNNRGSGYMVEYKWTTVFNQAANKDGNALACNPYFAEF